MSRSPNDPHLLLSFTLETTKTLMSQAQDLFHRPTKHEFSIKTLAASSATEQEIKAAQNARNEGSKPVQVSKRPWRPKQANHFIDPDFIPFTSRCSTLHLMSPTRRHHYVLHPSIMKLPTRLPHYLFQFKTLPSLFKIKLRTPTPPNLPPSFLPTPSISLGNDCHRRSSMF